MNDEFIHELESSQEFKDFLWGFGVKGIEEYMSFTVDQKLICIKEFLSHRDD